MSRVQLLLSLQATDQEWDEKGRRYQLVRKILSDSSELTRLHTEWQQTKLDLAATHSELRNHELEISSMQDKLHTVQDSLYSGRVRLPKDLETLQKESAILQQRIKGLEDTILELMAKTEELEELERSRGEAFTAYAASNTLETEQLTVEYRELRSRLKDLQELRVRLRGSINSQDLALYDELRTKKNGQVLSPMAAAVCRTCRVSVPVRKAQLVESGEELVLCEGCGRILYPA